MVSEAVTFREARWSTYDLATTSGSAGDELPLERNAASFRVPRARADEVINGELDGFLRGDTLPNRRRDGEYEGHGDKVCTHDQLRTKTTVEAEEALVPEDLSHAVQAVLVQQLPDDRAPLVLHPILSFSTLPQDTAKQTYRV